jgi:hypothetical protein
MYKLKIADLLVTQNILRNFRQIDGMVEHVDGSGLWTAQTLNEFNKDSKGHLIAISEFPDKSRYIRDGHHRCFATLLSGREHLADSEYVITPMTYEQYMSVNFDVGWVTPFDPRHEVRLSDFMDFKQLAMYMRSDHSDEEVIDFIKQNKFKYMCPRSIHTVAEMFDVYKLLGKIKEE